MQFGSSELTRSFKFRIKTNKTISAKLENTLDLSRFLYNAALQERRDAYKINRVSLNYYDQAAQLSEIKRTNPEYKGIYSQVLQDVLKRLDKCFQSFFRRVKQNTKAGFPRFQSKHRFDSFCYPQSGFRLSGNKLILSKIGAVKIRLSREIIGLVKTCTIKKELDKWFVIFTVITAVDPLPKVGLEAGLDVGISSFATLSDGTKIVNFKFYESTSKKLRVVQRRVSRRKKGSSGRRKAVFELRKIHQKIKNQRDDFHYKVSAYLIKTYDVIYIEKLNIEGMFKGFLNKQILDAGWGSFFSKLKSKAECAAKTVIEVSPAFTSQDCSSCGSRIKKDLSERTHYCSECGLRLDRDVNAARNILALGRSAKDLTRAVG